MGKTPNGAGRVTLHLLTPEYPPLVGGVSDYTSRVARGLAEAGEQVHVWCPALPAHEVSTGIDVHPEFGRFAATDLERVGRLLDRFERPRRLVVQWVPHGYGRRSMNLGFCAWLWGRARRGDRIELMVHEPYLALWEGTWRQTAAAVVHRLMTLMLLRAARRVWVAIPAWTAMWRPYALGRAVPFEWLPVPSGVSPPDREGVALLRVQLGPQSLIGHLGTYGPPVALLLHAILPELLRSLQDARVLLIGSGSQEFAVGFAKEFPSLARRVSATGSLSAADLARHVAACDVLVQPYPDGVSSRRTSVMAGLHLGVPVVTMTGKLTEPLWETSGAVKLTAVGDTVGFVDHVRSLVSDPVERRRLAETAQRLYALMFDVNNTVSALRSAA